jgi:cellulose synthase/poly-beta-1,6-N-acetylglucosamine synthase-like glycosyltransferase
MGELLLAIYAICMLCILAYSMAQAHLLWLYLRSKKKPEVTAPLPEELPAVTIQLPVYNEPLVIERLIRTVVEMDYPAELLEIQVLDDSTDATVSKAAALVADFREKGIDIVHVRREARTGFKAGALDHGMKRAKGEFIAIFDADFLPKRNFLKQTMGHFHDPMVGAVQVRWEHLNRGYNLLTRLLAMTLDAHFTIEQRGRSAGGNFINFNGTAGIWRRSCINDAGDWRADSLTEDLDLSYRAQLRGWKICYLEDVTAPAEIPMLMPAIRSQQYRWNKGGAEVARMHLGRVLGSDVPFHTKFHAVFHLLNTAVFISVLAAAVVSVPLLLWLHQSPLKEPFLVIGMFFFAGFGMLAGLYWVSIRQQVGSNGAAWWRFLLQFPMFLALSMGLSLFNSIAVIEGYAGRRTPFVRTPKFASVGNDALAGSARWGMPPVIAFAEAGLAVYFMVGIGLSVQMSYHPFLLFHLLLSIGFATLALYSVRHARMV